MQLYLNLNPSSRLVSNSMSNIYHTEPPTQGKVVISTSYGDVDIELWPKEAPLACRNFVQLCLEGYYDNSLIHRIIKDFMIQMVRYISLL